MKRILLILILFLSVGNTFPQNKTIDSLKLALKNAKHDSTRCNILSILSETANDEEWPVFNEQLKTTAEKNLATSSPHKNIYLKHLGNALNNIGFLSQQKGHIRKALEYFQKSLNIQEEIRDKTGIALSLNNIGAIYNSQGDIPKALGYYHRSLKIREEIGDKIGIALSLNNIGAIYNAQGDIPKALEYNLRSLKLREEMGDKKGIAYSLISIGAVYFKKGDLNMALDYYHKSLKIREEIGDKNGIAYSLNNIGVIYSKKGDLSDALDYYHKSLKIQEEIGDKSGIAYSLNNIGSILFRQGKYTEAIVYVNKAMSIAEKLGFPKIINGSAHTLKNIYQKQNKYKEAFDMFELEIKMRDSIQSQEIQNVTIKKQFQYQYEKQAAQDSLAHAKETEIKNIEIARQTAEIKVKKNQQYVLYGGLILVLVFAGFMFNRFKITQNQKHIITIQKELVDEKHKEITDSISYAERIQRSFLASKELLDENLNDYFVFFQPKDVVSGDFYWASKLNNGNFALATADSTGHGVPGAIMSLLNITSLEKAIETHTEPSDILNATRKTIIERLKKDGSSEGGKDGMDASLICFDFKKSNLTYSAGNNPVWIIRDRNIIELPCDKMPVGKHDKDQTPFTQHKFELQKGDVVYALTDGMPDQFGGPLGKKFMYKKLKEFLISIANEPMEIQKQKLNDVFCNWKGELEQVDDITIIGIKI